MYAAYETSIPVVYTLFIEVFFVDFRILEIFNTSISVGGICIFFY